MASDKVDTVRSKKTYADFIVHNIPYLTPLMNQYISDALLCRIAYARMNIFLLSFLFIGRPLFHLRVCAAL